jgi:hypothetical protein
MKSVQHIAYFVKGESHPSTPLRTGLVSGTENRESSILSFAVDLLRRIDGNRVFRLFLLYCCQESCYPVLKNETISPDNTDCPWASGKADR